MTTDEQKQLDDAHLNAVRDIIADLLTRCTPTVRRLLTAQVNESMSYIADRLTKPETGSHDDRA